MSEADNAFVQTEQIRTATAELDRCLRRMHVPRGDRRALVEEVRGDLRAAAADGVGPAALIGTDVDAFAREAIEAGGYRARPHDYGRVLAAGTLAAGVVVVAAYWLVVEALQPALSSWFTLEGRYPALGPVVVYGAVALAGLLGALAGLRVFLAGRPAARATLTTAALLLPVGTAAGVAAVLTLAGDPDHRSTPATVTVQVLFVLIGVVAALGASRWWAVRTATDDADGAARTQGD